MTPKNKNDIPAAADHANKRLWLFLAAVSVLARTAGLAQRRSKELANQGSVQAQQNSDEVGIASQPRGCGGRFPNALALSLLRPVLQDLHRFEEKKWHEGGAARPRADKGDWGFRRVRDYARLFQGFPLRAARWLLSTLDFALGHDPAARIPGRNEADERLAALPRNDKTGSLAAAFRLFLARLL